jgi:hypothetical protein
MQAIRFPPAVSVLCALGLFGLAWMVASLGFDLRSESARMATWSSTEGVIVDAQMLSKRIRDYNLFAPRHGRRTYSVHSTTIAYQYAVEGKQFVSTSISMAKGFDAIFRSTNQGGAAYQGTWLAMYPEGKRVTVYYDPADPATAILERDEPWITYLVFAAAMAIALVGLAFVSSAREQWKESRAGGALS